MMDTQIRRTATPRPRRCTCSWCSSPWSSWWPSAASCGARTGPVPGGASELAGLEAWPPSAGRSRQPREALPALAGSAQTALAALPPTASAADEAASARRPRPSRAPTTRSSCGRPTSSWRSHDVAGVLHEARAAMAGLGGYVSGSDA